MSRRYPSYVINRQMYKILFISIATLLALVLIYFFVLGYLSRSGGPPGLSGESLAPCPDKPNCVSSEVPEDAAHYVKPLFYSGLSSETVSQLLKDAIEETGGKIVAVRKTYLAATYSVSFFGFIDDVECRLDKTQDTIHIRSASRVGHNDLGVNRKRVARITGAFYQNIKRYSGANQL